ncbi:hypothetical protein ACQB60_03935 [Actinomycetota bacterium Odt1-20B]
MSRTLLSARAAAFVVAAALASTVALPAAAHAAPAAPKAPVSAPAAPVAAPGDDTPIVAANSTVSLGLNADLGIQGNVGLKIGSGRIVTADHRIVGGTVNLTGVISLKAGAKAATVSNVSIDLATGAVRGSVNGRVMVLGSIDTSSLHAYSKEGEHLLHLDIGLSADNNIVLSAAAAARLNAALGVDVLAEGAVLTTGSVDLGLNLDAALAADLDVDLNAAVDAGIDVDLGLNADIDLGLNLLGGVHLL